MSDSVYFVRNVGFEVLYPLWHKRWSNPSNKLLKQAKAAGTSWRK